MELFIITGLSGAGKTRAADICEDLGYYCVDNLPIELLTRFAALCSATHGRYDRVALVMDVRSLEDSDQLQKALDALRIIECTCRILYLEAEPSVVLRRYKESRRPHPLSVSGGTTQQAMEREREFLAPLRASADFIIDTSSMSLNMLKSQICQFITPDTNYFTVNLTSFGYKHGIPAEADLVIDVRCLPNPFYESDLRDLNGLDAPVADFVFRSETSVQFLRKLEDFLIFLLPLYREDRSELCVAIGCTGGHHRSVAVAQALGDALETAGFSVNISHRDLSH